MRRGNLDNHDGPWKLTVLLQKGLLHFKLILRRLHNTIHIRYPRRNGVFTYCGTIPGVIEELPRVFFSRRVRIERCQLPWTIVYFYFNGVQWCTTMHYDTKDVVGFASLSYPSNKRFETHRRNRCFLLFHLAVNYFTF